MLWKLGLSLPRSLNAKKVLHPLEQCRPTFEQLKTSIFVRKAFSEQLLGCHISDLRTVGRCDHQLAFDLLDCVEVEIC